MEGADERNGVLESPDQFPQLFINELLNNVDDLQDEALLFYQQQAAKVLKIEGSERTRDLSKGVAYLGDKIRMVMDNHLGVWEKYCLQYVFKAPKGFSFSKSNSPPSDDASVFEKAVADLEQLDTLRSQLQAAREESDKLNRELQALEMESAKDDHNAKILKEVLETCEQNKDKESFHDMMITADEFRSKVLNMMSKVIEEKEIHHMDYGADSGTGLSSEKLGDLWKLINDLKQK